MDPSSDVNTAFRDASSLSTGNYSYGVREAVGVFSVPEALERAVDELEVSGFDRAALSVLASEGTIKDRVGHLYRNIAEIVDGRHVPQRAFVESDSRIEGAAATIGIPCYIGSVAGAGSPRLVLARQRRPSSRALLWAVWQAPGWALSSPAP